MRASVVLRTVAIAVTALVLTGCTGLPTSGPVGIESVGDTQAGSPLIEVASGPVAGAGPEEIVAGFLDASITPTDSSSSATGNWPIARQFLSPELAETWRPTAGVTIEATGGEPRTYESSIADDEDAEAGAVLVELDQRASIDESGQYTQAVGDTELAFQLARDDDGEWRITSAPDGIVLDQVSFLQVYNSYSLQYFDHTWSRLVPDVRWYLRRSNVATSITRAVVEGEASEWLAPGVQSAFPADVLLDRSSVPITGQVADVALNDAALSLDTRTLARMRTQLEQSLRTAGVTEVTFTVNGRILDAGTVTVDGPSTDTTALVLTEEGFGSLSGGEVDPVTSISADIAQFGEPIAAIDVGQNDDLAAVQSTAGGVWAVRDGQIDQVDARAGLVAPSIDPYGYIWTAPSADPSAVRATSADVTPHEIADAWPSASSITALRVSSDGVRIAALVTIGGRQSVVTAVIRRDDSGAPTALGPIREVSELRSPATGLSWLGTTNLGILVAGDEPLLVTQMVGGPSETQAAPSSSVSISGSPSTGGARILGGEGVLFKPRVSAWQEDYRGVLVLATRAGY